MIKSVTQIQQLLIDAVFAHRLLTASEEILSLPATEVDDDGRLLASKTAGTCRAIGSYCAGEQDEMIARLAEKGILARKGDTLAAMSNRPYHVFHIDISPVAVKQALAVAQKENFQPARAVSRQAIDFICQVESSIDLVRVDDVTTRMVINWGQGKSAGKYMRIFRPTVIDYLWFPLPKQLWSLYVPIRLLRLSASRLVGRHQSRSSEFLGTPKSLVPELLRFAGVTKDDVLIDLGCGDGRIVLDAAKRFGCRAIGIENRADLVELAQTNANTDGLHDLVNFVHGDTRDAPLDQVSVVFLFQPRNMIRTLVPSLLKRLRPGTRIVVHEQAPLAPNLIPHQSRLLVTESAATVAHLWQVK